MQKRFNKKTVVWIAVTALILGLILGFGAYVSEYYYGNTEEIQAFWAEKNVERQFFDGGIAFGEEDSEVGFIFYPGGKVEYTAYEPLMAELASKGVLCVLIEMPFNLAVLDVNAADGICEAFPKIDRWYIGGHSLGGAMAASYASKHKGDLDGVVLLGAYSTADLSSTPLRVLSVYGSEDGVMNREKYSKYKRNLPIDFTETVIEGGCHSYFGMYGMQDGDGTPKLTPARQIGLCADHIAEFFMQEEIGNAQDH